MIVNCSSGPRLLLASPPLREVIQSISGDEGRHKNQTQVATPRSCDIGSEGALAIDPQWAAPAC